MCFSCVIILSRKLSPFVPSYLKIIKCLFKNHPFSVMREGIHSVRANISLLVDGQVSWYFHIKKQGDRLADLDAILCTLY